MSISYLTIAQVFQIQKFSSQKIDSIVFQNAYYRYYVNTEYISMGALAYFVIMWIVGFTFINIVGMGNRGPDPFCDKKASHRSFYMTILFSFIWFFISGIVVLR